MTLWSFKNRKSRRELENEILRIKALHADAVDHWDKQINSNIEIRCKISERESELQTKLDAAHQEIETLRTASEVKPQVKIEVVQSLNLTLAKWLKEENLIASAANILKHPDLRAMLDVLRNEHPGRGGIPISTATPDQRAAMQAMTQGYQLCLNNLLAMGEKPKKKTEIEETWGTEKEKV